MGFENQRRERDHIFEIGHGVEELGEAKNKVWMDGNGMMQYYYVHVYVYKYIYIYTWYMASILITWQWLID